MRLFIKGTSQKKEQPYENQETALFPYQLNEAVWQQAFEIGKARFSTLFFLFFSQLWRSIKFAISFLK